MLKRSLDAAPLRRQFTKNLFPIILSALMIGIHFFGSPANSFLQYQREAILSGQIWRLITGHLVHLSLLHLLMNIAALALFCNVFECRLSNKHWLILSSSCGCGISIMLLAFNPGITWYVGLSGVLHGLFVVAAILEIRSGQRNGWIWLILICIKILLEQILGPAAYTEAAIGGRVIVNAHLYGAVTGFISGIVICWIRPCITGHRF